MLYRNEMTCLPGGIVLYRNEMACLPGQIVLCTNEMACLTVYCPLPTDCSPLPLPPAKNYKTRNALLPYNRGVSPPGSFEMIVNYGANR